MTLERVLIIKCTSWKLTFAKHCISSNWKKMNVIPEMRMENVVECSGTTNVAELPKRFQREMFLIFLHHNMNQLPFLSIATDEYC